MTIKVEARMVKVKPAFAPRQVTLTFEDERSWVNFKDLMDQVQCQEVTYGLTNANNAALAYRAMDQLDQEPKQE